MVWAWLCNWVVNLCEMTHNYTLVILSCFVAYHRQLNHPNIIPLLGYAKIEEEVILIMKYVDGQNLDHFLFGKKKREVCHLHVGYDWLSMCVYTWLSVVCLAVWCWRGEIHSHKDCTCSSIHASPWSCGDPPRYQATKCASKFTNLPIAMHMNTCIQHWCRSPMTWVVYLCVTWVWQSWKKLAKQPLLPRRKALVPFRTWHQRCSKRLEEVHLWIFIQWDAFMWNSLENKGYGLDWMAQK